MVQPPKVFMSHASEDRERFVVDFATKLREQGVDVWLDRWEMGPGDSLVDKIFEEGIGSADALIIVLSQYSVDKPWVRAELNVGVVKSIVEKMRIIPVVLDDPDMPQSLKDKFRIRIRDLSDYDAQVNSIVNQLYGFHDKPPLGQMPAFANVRSGTMPGLAAIDNLMLKLTCERAIETGDKYMTVYSMQQQAEAFDISEEELQEAFAMLEEEGFVEAQRLEGASESEIYLVTLTTHGFRTYADSYIADYGALYKQVAAILADGSETYSGNIAKMVGQPEIVIEFVLDELEQQGYIELIRFEQGGIHVSSKHPKLKRMLRDS